MPRSSSPTTGWYGQLRNSLICNVGFLAIPVVLVDMTPPRRLLDTRLGGCQAADQQGGRDPIRSG